MKRRATPRIAVFMLCLSVLFLLFTRTHHILTVSGVSMVPTLKDNQLCITSDVFVPQRGNIYVVLEPDDNIYAVKRLVGVPGDTVELRDGYTYVNGELFHEEVEGSWEEMRFTLGANEYLFLGDNRKDSYDGRYWSRPLRRDEILFEVCYKVFPFTDFGRLEE